MTKKFIILCGRYRFFSSLSFYHGLDMFLATRDALVINGSYPGFFTSSVNYYCWFRIPPEKKKKKKKRWYVRISMNIPWKNGVFSKKHPTGGQPPWDFSTNPTYRPAFMLITRPRTWWKKPDFFLRWKRTNKSSTNQKKSTLVFHMDLHVHVRLSILMYLVFASFVSASLRRISSINCMDIYG